MALANNVNSWIPRTLEAPSGVTNVEQLQGALAAHAGITNLNNNDLDLYLRNFQYYIGQLQGQIVDLQTQIADLQPKT